MAAWFSVIGSIIAVLMSIMDIQITNAAVEKIQQAMNMPLAQGSWISSAYLIAEIVTLPLTAMLTQRLGLKRYAWTFCLFFIGSSILCAHAWNFESLIAFRILQGIGGGALMPFAYTLIITKLPIDDRPKAIALFGATVTLAPTIGPSLAGILTEQFGWPVLFYMNLPIGLLAMGLMAVGLRNEIHEQGQTKPLDLPGLCAVVIGLGCLQFVLEEGYQSNTASSLILALTMIAIIALTYFVWHSLRISQPLVNLRLLKNRDVAIPCAANFIVGGAMFGSYFLIPFFLVTQNNYTPSEIGQVIMYNGAAQFLILSLLPTLLKRYNKYLLISVGGLIGAVGTFCWGYLAQTFSFGVVLCAQILRGLGQPLMLTPLGVLIASSVSAQDAPSASILFNILRSLGGAMGVASLTAMTQILYDFYHRDAAPTVEAKFHHWLSHANAFQNTFMLVGVGMLVISATFLLLYRHQVRITRIAANSGQSMSGS